MTRRTQIAAPLSPPESVTRYRDRIFDAKRHDPYEPAGKYAEPTRCPQCGAVYERGRWRWGAASAVAHAADCPACRRAHDQLPAGLLTLEGLYAVAHAAELVRIARNEAEHESAEHPMHRIMHVDERDGRFEISTTDIHLPQRIAEAVKRAYHGELRIQYAHDEYAVRVHWHP